MRLDELIEREPELGARALRLVREPELEFPVLSAKIKLTWRCNLRCHLCRLWQKPEPARREAELEPALVERTIAALKARGLRKIHFSGGEVMVYQDFPRLLEFARGLDLQVNLTTNGTLVDKDAARALIEARTHSVTVSIDSPRPRQHDEMRGQKGAWKKSIEAIDLIRRRKDKKGRGPAIAVNTIVTRKTAPHLDELYDLLAGHGVERWRLLPVDSLDKKHRPTEDQWAEIAARWDRWRPMLTRLPIDFRSRRSAQKASKGKYAGLFYRDRICFAPWFNLFIDADGQAYPCCMGKQNIQPYGDINAAPIAELLDGTRRREIRATMAAGYVYPICEYCDDYLDENEAFWRLYATNNQGR